MAVWSSVKLSALPNLRLDAEYYTPSNLRIERIIKSYEGGWMTLNPTAAWVSSPRNPIRPSLGTACLTFSRHVISTSSSQRMNAARSL